MRMKAVMASVAGVAFLTAAGDESGWNGNLVVENGSPLVLGSDYSGRIATNVVIHDDLVVGVNGTFSVYPLDDQGVVTESYLSRIALGPDSGDSPVFEISGMSVVDTQSSGYDSSGKKVSTWMRADLVIGERGGNGKMVLGNSEESNNIGHANIRTVQLAAGACTQEDAFDVAEVHYNCSLAFNSVYNYNDKPMRITFSNPGRARNDASCGRLMIYADSKAFRLEGGGDIVLKGDVNAPVVFRTWSDWGYKLFGDSARAYLRFEGGDVVFDVGSNSDVLLNSANVVWNNSGNMIVTRFAGSATTRSFCVQAENALPYGNQTGNVIVRPNASGGHPLKIDICGKSQRVNGLVLEGGSSVISSSPAEIAFGTGSCDGMASGVLTADNIMYVKGGDGTLVLSNATVDVLCVTGGVLSVAAGTVNEIGTLAITNAAVSIAPGGRLNVAEWSIGENVERIVALPTDGMTNVVSVVTSIDGWSTLVKDGPGFQSATLPEDAGGAGLHVKAGTLRLGGEVCTNAFWRFIAKRAQANQGDAGDVERGKSYNIKNADGTDRFVYVPVGLGSIGLFTPDGLASQSAFDSCDEPEDFSTLPAGGVAASPGFIAGWNLAYIQEKINSAATRDPVLDGGTSGSAKHFVKMNSAWLTDNKYDVAATKGSESWIPDWSGGILYTNDFIQLDPEDATTWKTVTWRWKSDVPGQAASYSLRRIINNAFINVCDWELQSSPDGREGTWVTMDERSGQTFAFESQCGLNPDLCYTYNMHIPYLFESRNANWRFTTFGIVEVDKGGLLDLESLRTENIAINALKLDLTEGGGMITKFVPADGGNLYLVNPPTEEGLAPDGVSHVVLPLTVGAFFNTDAFGSWTVYLDGRRLSGARVGVRENSLVVTVSKGFKVIVR